MVSHPTALVVTTYRVKTAFTGASIVDTVTCVQILDVTATPTTVATIWRNQATASDLAAAPLTANLEMVGSTALIDAQLRATAVPVSARAALFLSATAEIEAAWRAYAASGDLPDIPGVWGEDGVIPAAEAQAAHVGLTVHSIAGAVPADWAASVLAGHGYAFEPEPEI